LGDLIKKHEMDTIEFEVSADNLADMHLYASFSNNSIFDVLKSDINTSTKLSFTKTSFEIYKNTVFTNITIPIQKKIIHSENSLEGLVFEIENKWNSMKKFNNKKFPIKISINNIYLYSKNLKHLLNHPSSDYFQFNKYEWIKSVFIPTKSQIEYLILVNEDLYFDGSLYAFPNKTISYRFHINDQELLNKTVNMKPCYFIHKISPKNGKIRLKIEITGKKNEIGVLGNLCFFKKREVNKNIILYLVDALRSDFGGLEEKLFKNYFSSGTIFENAYSNATQTCDAMPNLFTGKYKFQMVKSQNEYPYVPNNELALAEYLKGKGYITVMFTSNSQILNTNSSQGFDFVYKCWGKGRFLPLLPTKNEYNDLKYGNFENYLHNFLNLHQNKPLFIYFHTIEPHDPYELPLENRVLSANIQPKTLKSIYWNKLWSLTNPTESQINAAKLLYQDNITLSYSFFDKITKHLEDLAIISNDSLFIFCSDHGERFFEHQSWRHGTPDVFNEVLRIPLMIKGNGFPSQKIDENVQLTDIYPTIMNWLGSTPNKDLVGNSLLNFSPELFKDRIIYSDAASPFKQYSFIKNKLKIIISDKDTIIFNLENDPLEKKNLANNPEYKEIINTAEKFRSKFKALTNTDQIKINDEDVKRLKSLGYF
jgi:arylsulfatase A-like enzyme